MRTRGALLALAMILAGFTATAEAQQGTHCTAEFVVVLDPGIGSEPSSGTFKSPEPGTITCDGGGTGTFRADGRYGTKDGDTCSSGGEGWGVHSLTIDGKDIQNTFTFDFGGLSGGFVNGTFDGDAFSGTFTFTPTKGDCVTAAATEGDVKIDGTLKG
jgi:hypothetical protein